MEVSSEPGSARFGNFINYYQFNPPERRTQILSGNIEDLKSCLPASCGCLHVLDIGCNSGELVQELYKFLTEKFDTFSTVKFLAVDLDSTLIARAEESNKEASINYKQADIMEGSGRQVIKEYLTQSDISQFDVVTCFSTTMWIHLNYGDAGFRDFLDHIASLAKCLILEPQPWKCYRSAVRRMAKLNCDPFPLYKELQWRQNVEQELLAYLEKSCKFNIKLQLGQTPDWHRSLLVFVKQSAVHVN